MSFLTSVRSHVLARENEPIVLPFNRRMRQGPPWWTQTDEPTVVPAGSDITPRDDPFKDHPMHCKCYHHR